jgi:hypothetical protein
VERLVKGTFCLVVGMVLGQETASAGRASWWLLWVGLGGWVWWWPGGGVGTTRGGMVDRRATTLMYAGWDRRSVIRRKVPLTRNAAGQTGGHSRNGDQSCDGGAPARRTDQRTSSADRESVGRIGCLGWLVRRSSRPTRIRPARGRSRRRPRSWRPCGRSSDETARTGAAAPPTREPRPGGPGPAGGGRSGRRRRAGAARPRQTRPSHRARATIATQLLNAREPLSLADLQQWLGHKHPSSTRHYAAILQRTPTAAHRQGRLLRPQRAHHPGPHRPRHHPVGRGRRPWQPWKGADPLQGLADLRS